MYMQFQLCRRLKQANPFVQMVEMANSVVQTTPAVHEAFIVKKSCAGKSGCARDSRYSGDLQKLNGQPTQAKLLSIQDAKCFCP